MLEIERKFLARKEQPFHLLSQALATGEKDAVQYIRQYYLLVTKFAELRIRECYECNTGSHRMALKLGNGFKRIELEISIPEILFDFLASLRIARGFSKLRLMINGWAIDEFGGDLFPLALAEFESNEKPFKLPPVPEGLYLIKDVTEERIFANKNLAKLSESEKQNLVARSTRGTAIG